MFSFYLSGFKKIFNIGKKVFLVIAVYFIVISLFMYFINKDKPKTTYDPVKKNREEIYRVVNDPKLKKTREGKLTIVLYRVVMCGLVGEACSNNPSDGDRNFNKSLFGFMSNLIVLPYANPPASGIYWAYSGLQDAGFAPKTYAAEGIGFGAIKPFAKIWIAFRNVAYLVIVLVLITIGFMIMFRMKLNPQTVISVENSLPKIVLSLILVTFSFPIAGLLIDLMYIAIILIVSVIGPAGGLNPTQIADKQRIYIQAGPTTILGTLFVGGGGNTLSVLRIIWDLPNALLNLIPIIGGALRLIGSLIGVIFIYPWLAKQSPLANIINAFEVSGSAQPAGLGFFWDGLGKLLKSPMEIAVLFIGLTLGGTIVIPLIIGILILFTVILIFFRIMFLLLSAYVKILLTIIISPLYLLLEGIPGQSAFSGWLKNLVSELIVFPTIVTIFMMVTLIVNAIDTTTGPLLIQFPFMVGIDPKNFSLIVAMAILFLTPELVKVVKQLFVPKPGLLDTGGVGMFFAGAGAAAGGGLGLAGQFGSLALAFPGLRTFAEKHFGQAPILGDLLGSRVKK